MNAADNYDRKVMAINMLNGLEKLIKK